LEVTWHGSYSGTKLYITYTYQAVPSFAVLEDGSLYANNASICGNITATGGQIANWSIDWLLSTNKDYGKGLYCTSESGSTTGLAGRGDGQSVAFWAGCPGGTPWEVEDYDIKTGLFITEAGVLRGFSGTDKITQVGTGGGL
jgi:hypothetical protein